MEVIVRQVRELDTTDRLAIERIVGHAVGEDQKLVIQVMSVPLEKADGGGAAANLPSWCHVYDGLTDEEIAELEGIVLNRADLSRSI